MKKTLFLILLSICSQLGFAQDSDKLISKQEKFQIYQQADLSYYIMRNHKKVYKNLKFVKIAWPVIQVIDNKNNSFYLNDRLIKTKAAPARMGFCGTVPHYSFAINTKGNEFIVTTDETFFDSQNQIPPKVVLSISKQQVDELYFVNLEKKFMFTENYGAGALATPNPRLVIFEKDGQFGYYTPDQSGNWVKSRLYDKIIVENSLLKLYKNGLVGYQGINDAPKYTTLTPFDNYLAQFEMPDGQKGYLDVYGVEYFE